MPYRFKAHTAFVELELYGVLDVFRPFNADEWAMVLATNAILFNHDEVEAIRFDPWAMAAVVTQLVARGVRLAGYASQPAWFGTNRQMIHISGVADTSARVFSDRAAAIAWLRQGCVSD